MRNTILNMLGAGCLAFVSSTGYADTCKEKCLEVADQCNQECPMDQPANASCHAWCQVQYNVCLKKCASPTSYNDQSENSFINNSKKPVHKESQKYQIVVEH